MHIALGCDHRGFVLKQAIMNFLDDMGHTYQDFGCYDTTSVDYPDIAKKVGDAVAGGEFEHGILVCDTGIGMSMAANKVRGIRAALCCDALRARRAREHNDANVLCLSGGMMSQDMALEVVKVYLTTRFEGGRHARRVEKMRAMESES